MTYKAAELFDQHIRSRGITRRQAATELQVSNVSITYWANGRLRPRADMRAVIERWSGGAVPAVEWLTDEERARVDGTEEPIDEPPAEPEPPTDSSPVATAEPHAPTGTDGGAR